LAKSLGATVKPEVAVLSADHELLYRGGINDRYVNFGKQRAQPTTRELRAAIDAILNKQDISVTRAKAIARRMGPLSGR